MQQAVNQIPDSNFRIALGSADKTEQRDESVAWPRHLMAGPASPGARRGSPWTPVLHYFGVILWSL